MTRTTVGKAGQAVCAATGALAVVVLVGWLVGLSGPAHLGYQSTAMQPNSALCLLLLAGAGFGAPRLGAACAGAVAAIAAVTITEYAVRYSGHGFDRALFVLDVVRTDATRPSLQTATALLLLAGARLTLVPRRHPRAARAAKAATLVVVLGAAVTLLGYAFEVPALHDISHLTMAWHTALTLSALGLVTLVQLDGLGGRGLAWLLSDDDLGARLMRRVFAALLVALPLIGVLRALARRHHVFEDGPGVDLATIAVLVVVLALGWRTAVALGRADVARDRAVTELADANAVLDQRVRERAEQLDHERGRLAVLAERQRIAADLHDNVVQRLFAIGLSLPRVAAPGPDVERVRDGLEAAVTDLRHAIHELRQPRATDHLAAELTEIVDGTPGAPTSTLHLQGPLSSVPDELGDALLAVAREALSNARRHAKAENVAVTLQVGDGDLTLVVADDGCGISSATRARIDGHGNGLANLRRRAEQFGGTCTWLPIQPRGTQLIWCATWTGHHEHISDVTPPVTIDDRLQATLLRLAQVIAGGARGDPVVRVGLDIARLVAADAVSVAVESGPDHLELRATSGFPDDGPPLGLRVPIVRSLAGHVAATGRHVRIADVAEVASYRSALGEVPFGPAMLLPVRDIAGVCAVLGLQRKQGRQPFSALELEHAQVCVPYLAMALGLDRDGTRRDLEPSSSSVDA